MTCEKWDMGFTVLQSCMMCKDYGEDEEACNKSERGCMYSVEKKMCMKKMAKGEEKKGEEKKDMDNPCMKLKGKKCKKSKMCMIKEGKCVMSYTPMCMGVKEDMQAMCMKIKTKEECLAKKSMFNKPLCEFGMNKYDREKDHKKCMEDTGMGFRRSARRTSTASAATAAS